MSPTGGNFEEPVTQATLDTALGAGPGERTSKRIGKLDLRIPRDRDGRFSTELFSRYQRSEMALVSALAEMYVQGVSTRKVKAITEELCGHRFSAGCAGAA